MHKGMPWWIAWTIGLATQAQGFVLWILSLALGIGKKPKVTGHLFVVYARPWVEKRWNYTTTIAAWQLRPSWFDESTELHEDEHYDWYVDLNGLGLLQAAVLVPWLHWWAFVWYASSGAPWLLMSFVITILRYKRKGVSWYQAAYLFTDHEQAAYAIQKAARDNVHDRWEP